MTETPKVPMDEVAGEDLSLDAIAARYSREMSPETFRRFIARQREERATWKVRQKEKKDKEE